MKKTLLSVLAGLTVIGSAVAVPTPEDRKALCDLLIEKGTHVWVTKTQACIPINPCKSEDYGIRKTYCDDLFDIRDERQAKLFLERYAQNVLKTQISNVIYNPEDRFAAANTIDGGYFAVRISPFEDCLFRVQTVRKPYGKRYKTIDEKDPYYIIEDTDSKTCEDIKDFYNLLYLTTDSRIYYDKEKNACIFKCLKEKEVLVNPTAPSDSTVL